MIESDFTGKVIIVGLILLLLLWIWSVGRLLIKGDLDSYRAEILAKQKQELEQ